MKIKRLLVLLGLVSIAYSDHILSSRFEGDEPVKTCDGGQGECVPYYQCINGTFNTDGSDIFDVRFKDDNECIHYFETCCPTNDKKTTDEVNEEFKHLTTERPSTCGFRNVNGIGSRISGDENSEYGEFPWMAAIFEKKTMDEQIYNFYVCGGSLISEKAILTAVHCVKTKKPEKIWVRLGDWDTQTNNEIFDPSDHSVEKIVKHEKYYAGGYHNNIALLFLKDTPKLTTLINTICLPPQDQKFDGKRCVVAGWGKHVSGYEGRYQAIMKKVELPIVPQAQCEVAINKALSRTDYKLHESFLCAGGEEGVDACQGDGGSPLACEIEGMPGHYYQAGIVSWGIGCGTKGVPGIYADVGKFRNWIDQKIATN